MIYCPNYCPKTQNKTEKSLKNYTFMQAKRHLYKIFLYKCLMLVTRTGLEPMLPP